MTHSISTTTPVFFCLYRQQYLGSPKYYTRYLGVKKRNTGIDFKIPILKVREHPFELRRGEIEKILCITQNLATVNCQMCFDNTGGSWT